MYKVACPNFGMLDLRTKHRVCTCCRHATKKNLRLKGETISKLLGKSLKFGQDVEVRAHYPIEIVNRVLTLIRGGPRK